MHFLFLKVFKIFIHYIFSVLDKVIFLPLFTCIDQLRWDWYSPYKMVVYYSKKNINTTVLSLFLIISILLRLTGSDNDSMIFRFLYNCPCIKVTYKTNYLFLNILKVISINVQFLNMLHHMSTMCIHEVCTLCQKL